MSERKQKYNAKPVDVDGIHFDSGVEARRWAELRLLERAGVIHDVACHPQYVLVPAFTDGQGKMQRAITFRPDFSYWEDCRPGVTVAEDVKGGTATMTEASRLRAKLLAWRYPGVELRIVPSSEVG